MSCAVLLCGGLEMIVPAVRDILRACAWMVVAHAAHAVFWRLLTAAGSRQGGGWSTAQESDGVEP